MNARTKLTVIMNEAIEIDSDSDEKRAVDNSGKAMKTSFLVSFLREGHSLFLLLLLFLLQMRRMANWKSKLLEEEEEEEEEEKEKEDG